MNEILQRCGQAYERLHTLHAEGVFDDRREGLRQVLPIRWDLQRPDRCRLQIGMDVALVLGQQWWTYGAVAGRFEKRRSFTRTPIETAVSLRSRGVPFFLTGLWLRGGRALGPTRTGDFPDWQLQGVAWVAECPCYVVSRWQTGGARRGRELLRLWIDQDTFLLRGWDLSVPGLERPTELLLSCRYHVLVPDARLEADCFKLRPPSPIAMPPPTAASRQAEMEEQR